MPTYPSTAAGPARWVPMGWAALLALAALAAYHNTFRVPFLFDDIPAIVDNPTIRHLGNLKDVLLTGTSYGVTTSGRPVVNLSLALCYAISGTDVWSYHAFNLLVHVLAATVLFGVVRRTILRGTKHQVPGSKFQGPDTKVQGPGSSVQGPVSRDQGPGKRDQGPGTGDQRPWSMDQDPGTTLVAFSVALIWTLHPLQTEAVTYLVQRAESLMGLFYLLTLYCFIRGAETEGRGRGRWFVLGVIACVLGMASKEVMATAPVIVLLYDRTFVSGSFREAWRRHRGLHLALAATWLVLVALVASTGWSRGATVGFNVGVSPWGFWLTQFEAVARYLRLSFWPHPLVFEYGVFTLGWRDAAPYALVVLPLAAATLVALRRRPVAGFLGAWFFAILAPTSAVPGAMQVIVEHRMYLPLAAVIAAVVVGVARAFPRRGLTALAMAALALPLGLLTERRNALYNDDLALWQQTVDESPASARAQVGLGAALHLRNRPREALVHHLIAVGLNPNEASSHYNAGLALTALGQLAAAMPQYREAIRIDPKFCPAHYQLGLALMLTHRLPEAEAEFAEAVRLQPTLAEAHFEWGAALVQGGRLAEAVDKYREALRLKPDFLDAEFALGVALYQLNRAPEAAACFQRALQARPDSAGGHFNLGLALARIGRTEQAMAEYAEAIRLDPAYAMAHYNLGIALGQAGRVAESLNHLREAARLLPEFAGAHCNLGIALVQAGRLPEAVEQYETALRLRPDYAVAHNNLGLAYAMQGRLDEARKQWERALALEPNYEEPRRNLARLDQEQAP